MIRRAKPLLGTFVEVALLADEQLTQADAHGMIDAAFTRITGVHNELSFHRPDSALSRLNLNPCVWVPLERDAMRVLRLARALGRLSNNRFNCTLGGELVTRGVLPRHSQQEFLPRGEWQDIELGHQSARLKRPVLVTLDGIAKGYAVDMAVSSLRRQGAQGGWVNAGGDLRVFGCAMLPVHRRERHGLSVAKSLNNQALASSRVGGGLDPMQPGLIVTHQDGSDKPESHERVISIQAASAWRADGLTKVAAAFDDDKSDELIALLHRLKGQAVHFLDGI
ncbi:FAD:protein FMN transferase [Shewanella sp. AS1]|uniref:FAD:protein FMN transferase n=1 Tax=Shewanella sp. AS1 TaxID=2907626 RepID=UPI001F3610E6|nr:FAD:protein FMN transferase [Shewanella sp. AS1]MCE9679155.1 FAD:protein FMN transferase [Shewanella sp. AS1]